MTVCSTDHSGSTVSGDAVRPENQTTANHTSPTHISLRNDQVWQDIIIARYTERWVFGVASF